MQISVDEVVKKFPDGVPLLDAVKDMGIREKGFDTCVKNIKKFEERLYAHPLHNTDECKRLYKLYVKKTKVSFKIFQSSLSVREYVNNILFLCAVPLIYRCMTK